MEYLTKVQMIVKDEGYKYFAGRATFEGVTTSRATSGERRKERNTSGQRGLTNLIIHVETYQL